MPPLDDASGFTPPASEAGGSGTPGPGPRATAPAAPAVAAPDPAPAAAPAAAPPPDTSPLLQHIINSAGQMEGLTGQIAGAYNKEGRLKAEQDAFAAQQNATAANKTAQDFTNISQPFEKKLEETPLPAFAPTEQNSQDLLSLFGVISVMGAVLGKAGGGHQAALGAMDAMTGMMNGWQEGRQDLYQKEKDKFDENFKVVQQKRKDLTDALGRALQKLPLDAKAAEAEAQIAIAQHGGPLVMQNYQRQGLEKTAEMLEKTTSVEAKAVEAMTKLQAGSGNLLDDATATMIVQSWKAGDTKPAQMAMGYARNRPAILAQLTAKMHELYPGMTGDQLAALHVQLQAGQRGASALAVSNARIETALREMEPYANKVLETAKKLNPTDFPMLNSLIQNVQFGTGDPDVQQLRSYVTALQSAYGQVAQRGGAITNRARELSDAVIKGNLSFDQLKAATEAMKFEADVAKKAAFEAIKEMTTITSGAGGGGAQGTEKNPLPVQSEDEANGLPPGTWVILNGRVGKVQ